MVLLILFLFEGIMIEFSYPVLTVAPNLIESIESYLFEIEGLSNFREEERFYFLNSTVCIFVAIFT